MTQRQKILNFVATREGLTAWHIAKAINEPSASVSGTLLRLVNLGTLRREQTPSYEGWAYFKGPKFGTS